MEKHYRLFGLLVEGVGGEVPVSIKYLPFAHIVVAIDEVAVYIHANVFVCAALPLSCPQYVREADGAAENLEVEIVLQVIGHIHRADLIPEHEAIEKPRASAVFTEHLIRPCRILTEYCDATPELQFQYLRHSLH